MIFDTSLTLDHFKLIMQNSFDSLWVLNLQDKKLMYANKKPTEKMLGYPVESFFNNPDFWNAIVHDEDKEIAHTLNERCITNGEGEATYRMIQKNGAIIRVLVRQRLLLESGQPDLVIGSTVDVTNLYSITDELRRSVLRYNSFFLLSNEMLAIANTSGFFTEINPSFMKCMGYTNGEMLKFPLFDFLHPDDFDITQQELIKLSLGKITIDFENRYRCQDNSYRLLSWRCVPSKEGNTIFCVARDITAERDNHLALARSNQLLEATQAFTKVGGWEVDLVKNSVYWTLQTYYIHDTTPSEFTPDLESAINQYIPEDREILNKAVQCAIDLGKEFDLELTIRTKRERLIPVRLMGKAIVEHGTVVKLTGIFQDLTDSKKVAKLLDEQNKSLIQSAKMSSLGEMAASIAHEINNPLAIINGSLMISRMILEENKIDLPALNEQFDHLQSTSSRIVKIIRGLQLYSRNSDTESISSSTLNKIMDETLVFCEQRFKNSNVMLSVDLGTASGIAFFSSTTQISQVILNLLNNSFDAIKELTEKWIKVVASIDESQLIVEVIDSGTGIETGLCNNIMKPFFTTKEAGNGTGLGLSISRKIVESHGGVLMYDSDSPHTKFIFKIPLKRE